MLVIAGTIRIDPAKVETMSAAAREMMAETHKEEGCEAYVFSRDLEEPGLFHIFERWASDEALKAHFAAPHMAKFQAAMADFDVKGADILRYEISSSGPVRP